MKTNNNSKIFITEIFILAFLIFIGKWWVSFSLFPEEDSFLRENFNPRFINSTTEDAFYNFFVKRDIKIDYLHIDADHTYDGCKLDFDLYSTIMNENGIISIHDSDENYWKNFETYDGEEYDECCGGCCFIKEITDVGNWEVFNLFDYKEKSEKLSSSGLTILRKST